MSFFLDWFMFFGFGALASALVSLIRSSWSQWSDRYTVLLLVGLIVSLETWSVSLFMNHAWAYQALLPFMPVLDDPTGPSIMLHTYATGVTERDAGLFPVLWYLFYPVWTILGYRTTANLFVAPLKSRRAAAPFVFFLGASLLIFGLVRFVIPWATLLAISMTGTGIALVLIALYFDSRSVSPLLFALGGMLLIMGLVRFPISWAVLDGFNLTLLGIGMQMAALYLSTE